MVVVGCCVCWWWVLSWLGGFCFVGVFFGVTGDGGVSISRLVYRRYLCAHVLGRRLPALSLSLLSLPTKLSVQSSLHHETPIKFILIGVT